MSQPDRLVFSPDDRRRIKHVKQEVVAAAGFRAEQDAEFGYRAAKILADRPDDYDKEITLKMFSVEVFQAVSTRYNHDRKQRVMPTLRRARNALARREALDSYPVTGPGNRRQLVKEMIDALDEEGLYSAVTHIMRDLRGQYEPLGVYLWALATVQAIKAGRPEPKYKPLTQKDLDNDIITVLLRRYAVGA